ncbi:hypothetical protein THAOC_33871, partial [Thalassiosira oceanica]
MEEWRNTKLARTSMKRRKSLPAQCRGGRDQYKSASVTEGVRQTLAPVRLAPSTTGLQDPAEDVTEGGSSADMTSRPGDESDALTTNEEG